MIGFEFYREQVNKIMHVKHKSSNLQKILCVCLVAHETLLFIEQGLFTKSKNLMFWSKMHSFCLILKYLQVMWSEHLAIHIYNT